jgi:hypothetical protein
VAPQGTKSQHPKKKNDDVTPHHHHFTVENFFFQRASSSFFFVVLIVATYHEMVHDVFAFFWRNTWTKKRAHKQQTTIKKKPDF